MSLTYYCYRRRKDKGIPLSEGIIEILTITNNQIIMNMKTLSCSLLIFFLVFSHPVSTRAQAIIDFETGAVFNGYNDVRIPGGQGTLFSLTDQLKGEVKPFLRLRASYIINSRHTLSILYAPLETKSRGTVPYDILYEGTTFNANTKLTGTYKFNSYRLTYRYNFLQTPKLELGLGLTAKIREARILISSVQSISEKTNVGFVPIINFRFLWKVDDNFGVLLEGDALAAPQGRAEDILVAATYKLSDNLKIRAGYRILEGGTDNKEVYNFSLFNYALVGLSISL